MLSFLHNSTSLLSDLPTSTLALPHLIHQFQELFFKHVNQIPWLWCTNYPRSGLCLSLTYSALSSLLFSHESHWSQCSWNMPNPFPPVDLCTLWFLLPGILRWTITWLSPSLPPCLGSSDTSLFFIHFWNWSIVDLQYCVSFSCTVKWFNYIYIYISDYFPL